MVGKFQAFRQRHTQAGVCTFLLELLLGVTVLPLVKGTRPAVAILGLELVTGLTTRYATDSCRAKLACNSLARSRRQVSFAR